MHIMEGFLPVEHALGWTAASAPFVALGIRSVRRQLREQPEQRMLLGVAAAFSFVLSALKLPSVSGSCSHPTGVGLGALLFGPLAMVPVGLIVLLFQALLLAHGGLTTLGANVFSMGIAGPWVGYGFWRLANRLRWNRNVGVFLALAFADLSTYVVTSIQLGLAFPDPVSGIVGSVAKFMGIFALSQIPLAIAEGILGVLVFRLLTDIAAPELERLKVLVPKTELVEA